MSALARPVPSWRLTLRAEAPAMRQVSLFDTSAPDPPAETPCEHPERAWQYGLFGSEPVYCCTFCGAELPAPENAP